MCSQHGRYIFAGICNHIETCRLCDISAIIKKAGTMESDHRRSRATARYFMRMLIKRPDMDDEAKRICKSFLIGSENWDVKIHYSRFLTRDEVAESIFNAIHPFQRNVMRWPTRSYKDKYEKRNRQYVLVKKKLPNVSPQEAENDDLFQTAAQLGEDFLRSHAGNPKDLLRVLEVYRVFIT